MADEQAPNRLSANQLKFAEELADPDFSLSVPNVAKQIIRQLINALAVADAALDQIALRVTEDDYDNSSSALDSIRDSVTRTGRVILQHEY